MISEGEGRVKDGANVAGLGNRGHREGREIHGGTGRRRTGGRNI